MSSKPRTAFDRYFERRMKDPTFAAGYRRERAEIDATDKLIRALDAARERAGLTKADLARRIQAKPEIVRRLLTMEDGNPTMATVLKLASALGCHLELVPDGRARRAGRAPQSRAA